jgi:hypothetical protein
LLLEGEGGIGKSTLWRAGVAAARESRFCVLTARPAPAEAALSYAGLADLLDGHLDVLGELPEPQRHALEVVLLLAEPAGLPPDQRVIGAGLLHALRLLAGEGPVLIGVDDISWLDAASLAVVEFVARRLRVEPVGLLLTHRSDRVLPLSLEGLSQEGGVGRLLVGPLGVDGLYRVLHKELGVVLSRLALRRIHDAARGNPFFALELARALERGGRGLETGLPVPIPERLRDLVGDRIATLPVETVDVLFAVAALSRPTVGVVGAAIAGGVSALEPAVRAGVIELNGDRIRFSHPLLASAAHAEVAADHRRELYRRLAAVVVEPEERARYLALAADQPDAEIAATLEAARQGWPGRRIVLVFQPHRYTRTRDLLDEFARVLSEADVLVVAEVYPAGEQPIAGADAKALCRAIRSRGRIEPVLLGAIEELPGALADIVRDGDVVLTMGAGSIGSVAHELPARLVAALGGNEARA